MNIGSLTVILCLRAEMNVCSSFTYFLTELGENPYERSELRENRYSKGDYEILPRFRLPLFVKRKLSSTEAHHRHFTQNSPMLY